MAFLISAFSVAIFAVLALTASANVICQDPAPSQLHDQWVEYLNNNSHTGAEEHESFFAVKSYKDMILEELSVESQANESWLHGNQDNSQCNVSHIQNRSAIQDRSYCPWYNIISQSADRYPHQVAEARCRCTYGAGMGSLGACENVTYTIRVLRRTNELTPEGYCKFVPGWMSISVGCTMTMPL